MGRDLRHPDGSVRGIRVSIHAPRMGRDFVRLAPSIADLLFQFTRPAWGATSEERTPRSRGGSFNSRAPHGARLSRELQKPTAVGVSIHAPRMGRDKWISGDVLALAGFNSRAPHGARLRSLPTRGYRASRFNSRAPHGARLRRRYGGMRGIRVSIHAPRMGRDFQRVREELGLLGFNSRAPHGARLCAAWLRHQYQRVSIHAPRMGRDLVTHRNDILFLLFQFTRPAWGATYPLVPTFPLASSFNSRAPHGARL